jgi:hypothetical protein
LLDKLHKEATTLEPVDRNSLEEKLPPPQVKKKTNNSVCKRFLSLLHPANINSLCLLLPSSHRNLFFVPRYGEGVPNPNYGGEMEPTKRRKRRRREEGGRGRKRE